MRYCPTLRIISAQYNHVTDTGGREVLYAVPWAESLERLDMAHNQISTLILTRMAEAVAAKLE